MKKWEQIAKGNQTLIRTKGAFTKSLARERSSKLTFTALVQIQTLTQTQTLTLTWSQT